MSVLTHPHNDTYDTFCDLITKSNAKIFEIATGPGNVIKYILCKRPNFKVFGIDLSSNMIELAKQNNPEADFAVMDCRNIHVIDTKFDGILCAFCLPYLSKEESLKLISDAALLLEPDGVLYISTMEGDYNKQATRQQVLAETTEFMFIIIKPILLLPVSVNLALIFSTFNENNTRSRMVAS